jgi:hypothetical protein
MSFFETKQIWTEITLTSGRRGHVMHEYLSINGTSFLGALFKGLLLLFIAFNAILLSPAIVVLFFYKFTRYARYHITIFTTTASLYFYLDIKKHMLSKLLFFGWTSDDGTFNNPLYSMETLELFKTINTYAFGLGIGFFVDAVLYGALNKKLNLDDLYTQKPALKWVTMIGIYLVTMFAVTNLIL